MGGVWVLVVLLEDGSGTFCILGKGSAEEGLCRQATLVWSSAAVLTDQEPRAPHLHLTRSHFHRSPSARRISRVGFGEDYWSEDEPEITDKKIE